MSVHAGKHLQNIKNAEMLYTSLLAAGKNMFCSYAVCEIANLSMKEVETMSKIAVVYWSGTGNTEAMANEVAEGAKAAGAEVDVLTASEFGADKMDAYDAVAFGCPAMGAEELEDSEFEPEMFSDCEGKLGGKEDRTSRILWMGRRRMDQNMKRHKADGAVLACDSVLVNEAPDDDAVVACQALGKALC